MVSAVRPFSRSISSTPTFKAIRTILMVSKPKPSPYFQYRNCHRINVTYNHCHQPELDGRFHPFRKQRNALPDRLSVTCSLDLWHHCNADIHKQICPSTASFEEICFASSKSKSSQYIFLLPK